jgi:hypothetical protein
MTTQVLRRPTFSLKKALSPITKFFVRIYDSIIEARRLQAAMETAQHLKTHNKDFRNMSYGDIVQFIMEDTTKERD